MSPWNWTIVDASHYQNDDATSGCTKRGDLGDSELVSLNFSGDVATANLLLVDTDGDLGTDILVRQAGAGSDSLAVWRSQAVVDDQQSALQFQVPASLSLPVGTNSFEIPITAPNANF